MRDDQASQPADAGTTRTRCHCTGCGRRRTPLAEPGWPATAAPTRLLWALRGVHDRFPGLLPARWVDHAYRTREYVGGPWTYVAEPYALAGAHLDDLTALRDAGWQVVITARAARHVRGGTLHVQIARPIVQPAG